MLASAAEVLPSPSRHWDAVIPISGKKNSSDLTQSPRRTKVGDLTLQRFQHFNERMTANAASHPEVIMMNANRKSSGDGQVEQRNADRRKRRRRGRRSRRETPTRDYAALVAVFNGVLATSLLVRKCSREPLPERIEPKDLALFALATQKLSRVITKDKVTSAFRAPFTEVEGKGGPGEVEERAKGRGLRRAIGELLTCPFCLGTWIASGFIYGYIFVPRVTRAVASIFAVSGLADFLQQLYVKTQEMNE
jgi:Protein of unknown function (DUF1360)